jgi:hypothetical protein
MALQMADTLVLFPLRGLHPRHGALYADRPGGPLPLRDFADYLGLIFTKDGRWLWKHKAAPLPAGVYWRLHEGKRYHLDPTKAHFIKWYPWAQLNWFNPFTMLRWMYLRREHRTGLLIFKEPLSGTDAEPTHVTETTPEYQEVFGPAITKAQIASPNLTKYQKSQKYQKQGATPIWVWYVLIAVVLFLAFMLFTGRLR